MRAHLAFLTPRALSSEIPSWTQGTLRTWPKCVLTHSHWAGETGEFVSRSQSPTRNHRFYTKAKGEPS